MKAMSMEDLESFVEELRQKRPEWMYVRVLFEYEAWLEYYKAVEKREKLQKKKLEEEQESALLLIHATICKYLSGEYGQRDHEFFYVLFDRKQLELLRERLPDLLRVNQ